MKELTIEQKAQRYDEAIKKFDVILNLNTVKESGTIFADDVRKILPELAESEDERIRKELIKFVKVNIPDEERYIAWLKKQGESDETKAKIFLINKGYPIDTNGIFPTYEEMYNIIREGLEKQGEQKPIDKIQLGKKYKCIASPRYSTFMLGEIYKPKDKYLCSLMNFCSDCFESIEEDDEQKPADKIEPKFHKGDIIKPKDGAHEPWQVMQVDIFDKKYRFKDGYVINFSQEDDYELLEQKTTWNEEDKYNLSDIEAMIHTMKGDGLNADKLINWLKERVQPQPKQEWSEEDKYNHNIILSLLKNECVGRADKRIAIEWLKSLRPQPTWKPSEEQLRELENVFSPYTDSWDEDILRELHKQLKQL